MENIPPAYPTRLNMEEGRKWSAFLAFEGPFIAYNAPLSTFFDDATLFNLIQPYSYFFFIPLQIWLPDVEVLNLKMFRSLDVLDKLQGLWVSQNSEVLYVLAARITFICAMSFEAFPLDIQTCLFQASFSTFVNFNWPIFVHLVP